MPVSRLAVRIADRNVGTLALGERGRIYFQYDPAWIAQGFDLAPGSLDFNPSVQLPKHPAAFDGLHGVFHDSPPDGWGLLLMDRFFRQTLAGPMQTITPLDRLAYLGDRGMGVLEYAPALSVGGAPETVDLAALAQAAQAVPDPKQGRSYPQFFISLPQWRMATGLAYDLTFSAGMRGEHATDIAGSGNPGLTQVRRIARQAGISHWRDILEEVRAAASQWRSLAR